MIFFFKSSFCLRDRTQKSNEQWRGTMELRKRVNSLFFAVLWSKWYTKTVLTKCGYTEYVQGESSWYYQNRCRLCIYRFSLITWYLSNFNATTHQREKQSDLHKRFNHYTRRFRARAIKTNLNLSPNYVYTKNTRLTFIEILVRL